MTFERHTILNRLTAYMHTLRTLIVVWGVGIITKGLVLRLNIVVLWEASSYIKMEWSDRRMHKVGGVPSIEKVVG